MTEVLNVPRQPSGQSFYENSGLRHSSPSSSSLFLDTSPRASSPKSPSYTSPAEHQERRSSPSSSLSSSPLPLASEFSNTEYSTRASSGLSLESQLSVEDDITFPNYNQHFFSQSEHVDSSYLPNGSVGDSSDEPVESTTTSTTRSDSPLPTPTVADDTAIKQEPSHHVDYLSHNWREEDIWASWRHIVSQRKVYGQRSRLENASWRTWAKSKYHLRTVSPETLNWLKESDVTWLYGPLKPAESHPITHNMSEPASQLSKNNSFINKKPILKKRSMSEVMLQKSLSTSSLLKQAAAAVEAQGRQPRKSALQRANSDSVPSTAPSETPSRDQIDYFTSRSSSSGDEKGTPCECSERRHIRFDDTVEQCIAVDCKEGDFEDEAQSDEEEEPRQGSCSDSSSDDGLLMMRRRKRSGKSKSGRGASRRSRSSSHDDRKMIETLPSVNLKYRTDSPDVSEETQQHHTFGKSWSASRLSPSPSQETLRPSRPSQNFLIGDDDGGGEVDKSSSWSFGASNPKSSLGASASASSASGRGRDFGFSAKARSSTPAPVGDDYSMEGMRRTESGMFMPIDDEEDDMMAVGLFGKVSETINTARDIAHVIWNVGWKK